MPTVGGSVVAVLFDVKQQMSFSLFTNPGGQCRFRFRFHFFVHVPCSCFLTFGERNSPLGTVFLEKDGSSLFKALSLSVARGNRARPSDDFTSLQPHPLQRWDAVLRIPAADAGGAGSREGAASGRAVVRRAPVGCFTHSRRSFTLEPLIAFFENQHISPF